MAAPDIEEAPGGKVRMPKAAKVDAAAIKAERNLNFLRDLLHKLEDGPGFKEFYEYLVPADGVNTKCRSSPSKIG